jgi:integrase
VCDLCAIKPRPAAARRARGANKFSLNFRLFERNITNESDGSNILKFMGKTQKKMPRAQHNIYSVALRKTSKKPIKRRVRNLPPYLTVPEKDRFFRVCTDVRDRAIFKLLYFCGLRASEIGKLQMSDYRQGSSLNLDRLMIRRLKGSVSGETALVPAAAQALRAWVRKRGIQPGCLFPSRQKGPISRSRIFRLMQRYCKLANIPPEKAHPHTWKHTTCVHLLVDKKEGLLDIQKHVGHASVASTMKYLSLTSEFDESRIRRLSEWK